MVRSKKPKLRDLSRVVPSAEERQAAMEAFTAGSPLVVAVLGQGLVEFELDRLLRTRFPRLTGDTWDELTGDRGPLGTMYAKIVTGHAFRLYDEPTRDQLNLIRNIRNQFAHSKRLLSFDDPLIVQELRNAPMPSRPTSTHARDTRWVRAEDTSPVDAFRILCFAVQNVLVRRYSRGLAATSKNYKRTIARLAAANPFSGLNALTGSPRGSSGSSLLSPTADPSLSIQRLAQAIRDLEPPANDGK